MPLYIYRCRDCDHVFDVQQRMSDDPLEVCPVCGGHIRRVINSVGVVFKGKGFYVTDNRRNATLPSSTGGSETSGDAAKPSEKKSETSATESSTSASGAAGSAA